MLVGEKEESVVAADGAAERRRDIVQAQWTAAFAGDVGEPVVGRQRFRAGNGRIAEPWNSLEPERLVSATLAPGRRPISLIGVRSLDAQFVHGFDRQKRVQAAEARSTREAHRRWPWAGNPPAVTPVLALAPSTVK